MKILLIDDDRLVRMALSMVLKEMGMEVTCAIHGQDGLKAAGEGNFDLIFSDINMPVMDGLEFGRRLRADVHLATTPLIFMTGSVSREVEDELAKLGTSELLWKPIGVKQLQNVVRRFEAVA